MKRSITLLLTTALAVSPLFGEEKARPGKGKADGSFLQSIDKDGDKAISKEEAGERWERMSRLDTNGDGKVSFEEIAAGRPAGGESPGRPGPGKGGEPGEMFKRADKNGDGKISKDEVPEQAWNYLSRLDTDGDGIITAEEAKAGRPDGAGRGEPGEMLKRMDKNGDGNLSKDEVPAQTWERLGKFDKDNDGIVTKAEMAAGFAAMRAAKGREGAKGKGRGIGGPQEGGAGAAFDRFDKDKDGKLSEAEVPAEMWSKLRKADTDADGLVSREELEKVYQDRKDYAPGSN